MALHSRRVLRALALAALLLTGCTGQVAEVPLRPDDLMPPGSDERKVPTILFESLGLEFNASNQGWARGFYSTLDWAGTVGHVEAAAKAAGYSISPEPLIKSVDAEGIDNNDYIRDYLSPGQSIELILVNLDVMRRRGTQYDTSAKYLLMSGNRIELKAQIAAKKRNEPPPLPDNIAH